MFDVRVFDVRCSMFGVRFSVFEAGVFDLPISSDCLSTPNVGYRPLAIVYFCFVAP